MSGRSDEFFGFGWEGLRKGRQSRVVAVGTVVAVFAAKTSRLVDIYGPIGEGADTGTPPESAFRQRSVFHSPDFSVRDFPFALLSPIEAPFSSILWAPWTRRSQIASARVSSPMAACHTLTGI